MKSKDALLYTTVFTYIGAALFVLVTRVPLIEGINYLLEGTMYLLFASLITVAQYYRNYTLKMSLAGLYGIIAGFSFSGIQPWINYNGTTSLGPFMALWDIALAIALLQDV